MNWIWALAWLNLALSLWNMRESKVNADHLTKIMDDDHKRNSSIEIYNNELTDKMKEDIKQIHGRVCAMEERNKGGA